jgi:hypothetical protein
VQGTFRFAPDAPRVTLVSDPHRRIPPPKGDSATHRNSSSRTRFDSTVAAIRPLSARTRPVWCPLGIGATLIRSA